MNAEGISPLFQAAKSGNVQKVEELVGGGAQVDGCVVSGDLEPFVTGLDKHTGLCPLWMAVRYSHVGVVEALLRLGADASKRTPVVHAPTSDGLPRGNMSVGTPLLLAADVCEASELTEDSGDHLDVLRLLLEAGPGH